MLPLFRSTPVDYIDHELQKRGKAESEGLTYEEAVKACKCETCKCKKAETPTPPIGEMGEPSILFTGGFNAG